jgi:hypothetical protein
MFLWEFCADAVPHRLPLLVERRLEALIAAAFASVASTLAGALVAAFPLPTALALPFLKGLVKKLFMYPTPL